MASPSDLTNLQEILLVLNHRRNLIENASRCLLANMMDPNTVVTATSQICLQICTFMETWQQFTGLGKDPNVQAALRVSKPAIDKIGEYRNIALIRNRIVAHPDATRDGTRTWAWDIFAGDGVPQNTEEYLEIAFSANLACMVAIECHQSDFDCAMEWGVKMSGRQGKVGQYNAIAVKFPSSSMVKILSEIQKAGCLKNFKPY